MAISPSLPAFFSSPSFLTALGTSPLPTSNISERRKRGGMAEIRRFLPVRPIARRCRLSIIGESVVCLGKGFLEAIGRLIPLLSSRDGCNFATDWQKKKATSDSQRICEDFFREKEKGRRSAVTGGLRPGGLRPGGLRPGGLRPWGIEPT